MKWTKETPTEPGWYWYQEGGEPPAMYEVFTWGPGEPLVVVNQDCHESMEMWTAPSSQWYGPIQPPPMDCSE
jgi:hypothetical protein